MVINERIERLRKAKNMSREDLAEAVEVHVNIIGRYERGEGKPSLDVLIKLATVLCVSIDYLVGIVDEEVNREILNQILTIQHLPAKEQDYIMFTMGAMIRDAKSRQNYSK